MKKILVSILICISMISYTQAQKILVAYYSWGGNTEEVAKQIQDLTGGELFVIEPQTPYPSDYKECTEVAKEEINRNYRPPLKQNVSKVESYDVIFVGSPNWWSTIAPPVATFLAENNFSGKKVIPFVTHGGGGKARCFDDMKKLAPNADMPEGLILSGDRAKSSKSQTEKWLKELGVIK